MIAIPPEEVHFWPVSLNELESNWPGWRSVIDSGEVEKANRFTHERDRFRSAATRAALRLLLGAYLGLQPNEVSFVYNHFGKPGIPRRQGIPVITFSVSHSHEVALFGFSNRQLLGVDVERICPETNQKELASSVCSAAESKQLEAVIETERLAETYRFWTLKEAYLKALGVGLLLPVQSIPISREPNKTAGVRYQLGVRGRWTAVSISAIPQYAASVVVIGNLARLHRRSLSELLSAS